MGIPLDPNRRFPTHPSDEVLEEYVFHRLPEPLTAQVEEHLLICQSCQDAVAETDRFVSDLKVAVRQPAPAIVPVHSGWRKLPSFAFGRTSLAAVFVLAILVVLLARNPQAPAALVVVSLSSLRGMNPMAPAAAGKPLRLSIDLPDLEPTGEYRVEVVDASGSPVWKGPVSNIGGKLAATMPKPLKSGVYWVRLYDADSELLREFGLSAK